MSDLFFRCLGDTPYTPRDTMFNYDGDKVPDTAEQERAITVHAAQRLGIDPGRISTRFHDECGFNVVRVDGGDDEGTDRFAFQVDLNPPEIRLKFEKPAVWISHPDARHYGAYGRLVDQDLGAETYVVELLHGITERYQRPELAHVFERLDFKDDDGESTAGDWIEGDVDAPYDIGEYAWHRTGDEPLDHTLVRVVSRRYRGHEFRSYQGMVPLSWSLTVVCIRTGKTIEVLDDELQKAPRDLQNLHIRRQQAA